jgi:hypothetical protein
MALRMAEYCLAVLRLFGKFPRQVVLYVGEAPLAMDSELRGPDVSFRYRMIDIRDLDGDRLLESEETGDNVIAILARLRDHKESIRKIVGKIAALAAAEREAAFTQLLILAGLRRLEETVAREIQKMPVYIDLMENKVLGPAFKRGLEKGELEGELKILRRQIEKRFGPMPKWAAEHLAARSAAELEELSDRILEVTNIKDLLR